MFLPFLFFKGGFANISQWIQNFKLNADIYRYGVFPRFGTYYFLNLIHGAAKNGLEKIFNIITYIISFVGLFVAFFHDKLWKRLGIIICIILLFPVNSAFYCGLYLLPFIILFLNDEEHSWFDLIYLILFIILLNPFQLIIKNENISQLSINIAVVLVPVLLIIDGMIRIINKVKKRLKNRSLIEKENNVTQNG